MIIHVLYSNVFEIIDSLSSNYMITPILISSIFENIVKYVYTFEFV